MSTGELVRLTSLVAGVRRAGCFDTEPTVPAGAGAALGPVRCRGCATGVGVDAHESPSAVENRRKEDAMRIGPLAVVFLLVTGAPWAGAQPAAPPPLRNLADDQVVRTIAYCRSEYAVTMASGAQHRYPEYNLRFKTDSSRTGPESGRPALLPAGMRGDRAQVIFASPDELKRFLVERC